MIDKPLDQWSALEMSQELRKMSPSEQVDYLQRWLDAALLLNQRTIDALIQQRDEITAERDRWIERNNVLEERLAVIRKVVKP